MLELKYFKISEFDSPDLPNSGVNMDSEFLDKVDRIRGLCGFPFKINSGYRTIEHNAKVKGEIDSAHLRGLACDIKCTTSYERFEIVSNSLKCGIKRIGIYRNFVHLDDDKSLPNRVMFIGKNL